MQTKSCTAGLDILWEWKFVLLMSFLIIMQNRQVVSYDFLHLEKNLTFSNVIILIIVLIVLIG